MANLKITLKQCTPMIHFQSEQYGATLRATEFKPKLDKFLIKYAFKNQFNNYKYYLVGYKDGKTQKDFDGKEAFDYKLRICNVMNLKIQEISQHCSFYFNNIKKDNIDKNKFVICDSLDVEFFSLNKEILDIIKKYLEGFLLLTNFGFRQDKGFGSFYIVSQKSPISIIKKFNHNKKFFYIKYKNSDWKSIIDDAGIIYQLMKSGINFPDDKHDGKNKSYHKGYLFCYMKDNNIGNEKRFIKENFFEEEKRIPCDNMDKRYVRSMLGLAEGIEFKKKIEDNKIKKDKIKYSSKNIQRFKSPILFKIIDNILFIIPQDIPQEIFNQKFIFSQKIGKDIIKKSIYTPTEEEFNLDDFMESFVEFFNKELEVQNVCNTLENKLKEAKKKIIKVAKNK